MAMKSAAATVALVLSIGAQPLSAQTATTELDVTIGHSTEHVQAASSQLRIFGDVGAGWHYFAEGSWARQFGPLSDAFGAAYPYDRRLRPSEMYVEKTWQAGALIAGVRAGRYRTPFGISGRGDHGYNGFLRAPLIRYGGYWALSNNALEGGGSVIAGTPRLFAEVSLGVPQDQDPARRRDGLGGVARLQGTVGPLIVGVSHIRTRPSKVRAFAQGPTRFTGVDARWMYKGIQLRGEWLTGQPFNSTRTFGGYIDAIVHRPEMGPLTAVLRAERLDYDAGRASSYPRRYTAGARIRLSSVLVGQVNFVRQPADARLPAIGAFDFALTFTTRR
jgi:hypothetical protein